MDVQNDLAAHLALCQELLALVEREREALAKPDPAILEATAAARRALLPRLEESVRHLRGHRERSQVSQDARRVVAASGSVLRQTQTLIMRILLLDRENEQGWLRWGLVPARELAQVRTAPAHYAVERYRRLAAS